MKVLVKITPVGMYIMGDGDCPFDPDELMALVNDRIIDAQRRGCEEDGFEISDEEIEAAKNTVRCKIAEADEQVIEYETTEQLLNDSGIGR